MKVQREYKGLIIELETLDGRKITGRVFEKILYAPETEGFRGPGENGFLLETDVYTLGKSIQLQLGTVITSCIEFVDDLVAAFTLTSNALHKRLGPPEQDTGVR